jgi:hypothetical protein
MTLPTFILAGVEKSGSTSLYRYLHQHPDVYMAPVKEPDFFRRSDPEASIQEYAALFEGATTEAAIGEASVGYFNDVEAPHRIRRILPDVAILLVLRNPIERAYSHYNMLLIHGVAPPPPYADVLMEARRTGDFQNTGVPTSRYADSLARFLDVFGDRVFVHRYEDYRAHPVPFVQQMFEQVGVDPSFVPDLSTSYNQSYRPRSTQLTKVSTQTARWKGTLRRFLPRPLRSWIRSGLARWNEQPVPDLDDTSRQILMDLLRDDIERTESILQVDLSDWRRLPA